MNKIFQIRFPGQKTSSPDIYRDVRTHGKENNVGYYIKHLINIIFSIIFEN